MSKSAYLGSFPNNRDDYWIIKGMYRAVYQYNANPDRGYTLMPKKPSGYVYNDKQAGIIVGMSVAMVIMLIATCLRLTLRLFKTGVRWGSDDWVLVPGTIMAVLYPVLQMAMVTNGGGGKHVWDVTYTEYNTFTRLAIVSKILFFTSVGVIKISICLFLRRISQATTSKPTRIANDVFMFLLIAYTLLALFWTCFQCNPPPAMWNKLYSGKLATPAKCWSTLLMGNVLSVIHVTMDFILLITPIIVLWSIKLNKATKIRLFVVFSFGSLSCVASVFRELAQSHISTDITYGYTDLLAWTVVDLTLSVTVASLPVISTLIPKAWGELTHSSRIRRDTTKQGTMYATQQQTTTGRSVRRTTRDSDEDGILREDQIELTYSPRSKGFETKDSTASLVV